MKRSLRNNRLRKQPGWGRTYQKPPRRSWWWYSTVRQRRNADFSAFMEYETETEEPSALSDGERLVRTPEMQRVETILFLAHEPLGAKKLAQFAHLDESQNVRQIIRELRQLHDQNHYAFRVVECAGGFQLLTRPQFVPWLRRLCSTEGVADQELPEIQLSPAAMTTLAIIAYRQPIIRAEIEAIRGGACAEILRSLLSKDLIRIAGRSPELGRPRLYKTTRRFLEVFGLNSLSQLPKME